MLALSAFLCVAGIVVAGCITVPLGDPEQSKVDGRLTGLWLSKAEGDDDEQVLVSCMPYDARTALVTQLGFTKYGGTVKPSGRLDWKMWLTDVRGRTFATFELVSPQILLEPITEKYAVGQVEFSGDAVTLRMVSDSFVKGAKVSSEGELRKLIEANLDNPKLFADKPTELTRLTDEQNALAESVFDTFNGKGGE